MVVHFSIPEMKQSEHNENDKKQTRMEYNVQNKYRISKPKHWLISFI